MNTYNRLCNEDVTGVNFEKYTSYLNLHAYRQIGWSKSDATVNFPIFSDVKIDGFRLS